MRVPPRAFFSLAAINAVLAALTSLLVIWLGSSAYSYSRQQVRILDAPGVVDAQAVRDLLGPRAPAGAGAWYAYLYEPQLPGITRLAWAAPGIACLNALALAGLALVFSNRAPNGAKAGTAA